MARDRDEPRGHAVLEHFGPAIREVAGLVVEHGVAFGHLGQPAQLVRRRHFIHQRDHERVVTGTAAVGACRQQDALTVQRDAHLFVSRVQANQQLLAFVGHHGRVGRKLGERARRRRPQRFRDGHEHALRSGRAMQQPAPAHLRQHVNPDTHR